MPIFWLLLQNNLRLEFRLKETITILLSLAVMLAVIVSLGLSSAFVDESVRMRLFPALIWILFILSAAVSVGRSFEYELEHAALGGILLSGVTPATIYLAKFLSNFCILLVGQLANILALAIFSAVSINASMAHLLIVSGVVVLAYAALSTLLAGMSVSSRLKQILLPIILIPLVFPLFFAAMELTFQIMLEQRLDFASPWFSLLFVLLVTYIALGLNLFGHVIAE